MQVLIDMDHSTIKADNIGRDLDTIGAAYLTLLYLEVWFTWELAQLAGRHPEPVPDHGIITKHPGMSQEIVDSSLKLTTKTAPSPGVFFMVAIYPTPGHPCKFIG